MRIAIPRPPALLVVALLATGTLRTSAGDGQRAPTTEAALFDQNAIWNAHFHFSADAWAGLEPRGGSGNWGTIMAASQKNASRSNITWSLPPAMIKLGDRNGDARLDRAELRALADAWFARWDRPKAGTLDPTQLRIGLDAILDPQGMLQPGNFPISLEGGAGKRNGLASVMGVEFNQVHADLEFEDARLGDVGVRYKGNGSFVMLKGPLLKRSFKVDLNDFAKGQRLAGAAKLNFHNRAGDDSFVTESAAYALYRAAGVPAPRTAYARVFVTAPPKYHNTYFGLYSVVENVDGVFEKDRFGTKKGAIFKPTTQALFGDLGDDWSAYAHSYDPKTDLTTAQQRRVIDFAQLVTYADDAEFARRLGDFLDLDAFARFIAVTTFTSNTDSILHTGQNFYLYLHPKTHRFHFIPWDVDGAFGQIFGDQMKMAKLGIDHPWAGTNRFLERVFKTDAFLKVYHARLAEFTGTVFDPVRIRREIDATARIIRPAVQEESKERLTAFDKAHADGPVKASTGLFGTGLFADKPANSIKRFVDARTPAVLDQLAGRAAGERNKGFEGGGAWGRPASGPGQTLVPLLMTALDTDKDAKLSRDEFVGGLDRLFAAWGANSTSALTEEQIRAGIAKDLAPPGSESPFAPPRAGTTQPSTRPTAPR
jgi:spore coat protein CotH